MERQAAPEADRQCGMFFRRAGIVIEPFTVEQAYIARQAFHDFGKGRHPAGLNFGDCFAYALAKTTGDTHSAAGVASNIKLRLASTDDSLRAGFALERRLLCIARSPQFETSS